MSLVIGVLLKLGVQVPLAHIAEILDLFYRR